MRAGGRRREAGHSLFEIVVEEELGVFSENGAFVLREQDTHTHFGL